MEGTTPEREPEVSEPVVLFGAFELRLNTGELRKHGVRVRLQGKPFQILRALLERPGRVVSREDLRAKLWSSHTFVDFESGLNTAVNRLRIALGDSAEHPIYVETLARIGYRFIAPVTHTTLGPEAVSSNGDAPLDASAPGMEPNPGRDPGTEPRQSTAAGPGGFLKHRGWLFAAVLLIAIAAGAIFLKSSTSRSAAIFRQVTFLRGVINNARFIRGSSEIEYSAAWNGQPSHIYRATVSSPEAKDAGFGTAWLASVSPAGDVALFKPSKDADNLDFEVVSSRGAERRAWPDHVKGADWSPNGSLCLLIEKDSIYSVEYPAGHKLYTSRGWIDGLRVAPQGDRVAFLEHPFSDDDAGHVVVVNSKGEARVLSTGWASVKGLTWHPSGNEIWFSAARQGVDRVLMAVDMNGHTRQVAQTPGGLLVMDIDSSGNVLIARTTPQMRMLLGTANDAAVRNISLFDWSRAVAITPDGKRVLFDESGEGGGKRYSVFVYNVEEKAPRRVGDGRAMDISPDGRWVLTQAADDAGKLFLNSLKDGKSVPVSTYGLAYRWARFIPSSECREILFEGAVQGDRQIYRQELPGGTPHAIKPGLRLSDAVIDDSARVAVGAQGHSGLLLVDLAKGTTRLLPVAAHMPVAFANSRELITTHREKGAVLLDLVDVQTGQVRNVRKIDLGEGAGSDEIFPIHVSRDLRTFVYSRLNLSSNLYTVSGWN